CEHFFHGSPVPRKRGKGFFSCKILDWARAKRDKIWVRGQPKRNNHGLLVFETLQAMSLRFPFCRSAVVRCKCRQTASLLDPSSGYHQAGYPQNMAVCCLGQRNRL
ncbi:hypothetical protein, partial [uncultured Cardiobacterium sp.]|uniref:hypothetical protein n=1 Tax=uncultured Cardiobacterium sp. TaxID=417619 RepID=UPI002614BFD9